MSSAQTNQPLTIGIFSAYYPPHLGGVEQFTRNLALQLALMGHRPIVVTDNATDSPDVEADDNLVEVHRLPAIDIGGRFPLPKENTAFRSHWRLVREIGFDAIIVNTRFYPISMMGAQLAREQHLTPILIEHGSSHLTLGNKAIDPVIAQYEHAVSKRLLRCNPAGYGVSREAAAWMAHFGIEARGVIHNAIDAGAFRMRSSGRDFRSELGISDDCSIAAFTGRMIAEKGVWIIADSARMLEKTCNLHFVLAGDGPERERLQDSGLSNLHIVGRLDTPDVAALLDQSMLFCFPSAYPEGLPTSLLEACACGCYPITTEVGGAHEIVPSDDMGCILDEATPEALAQAVEEAIGNPNRTREAARRCQKHIEESFSWEATARAVLDAVALTLD